MRWNATRALRQRRTETLTSRRDELSDAEWYQAVVAIHVNAQTLARQIDKLLEEVHAEVQALGLHIVRNLAQAMGGGVSAHRNHDRGSTFMVRLPAAF